MDNLLPELGVGVIYTSGFENLVEENKDLIDVIEIEPQTFWNKVSDKTTSFHYDPSIIQFIRSLEKPVTFHGVGYPVGGTNRPDPDHLPCMYAMINDLSPVWISEHLAFNTVEIGGKKMNTNFLLPPLQTEETVSVVSESVKWYKDQFDLPFAFETGANYLSPQHFEMEDGQFIQRVAEASDSWILMDVHNLLANQLNGRQKIMEWIEQVDPQRIIQIHLAGGFHFKDYYLDAHSGVSSDEVLDLYEKIVKRLPNLKAVTFEMLPEYISYLKPFQYRKQLEKMRKVWDKRGCLFNPSLKQKPYYHATTISGQPTTREWEETLGRNVTRRPAKGDSNLSDLLEKDKGVSIIRDLIDKFRASLVVSSLKLTSRYLMLVEGQKKFNDLLQDFWQEYPPQLFASDNGVIFADYLLSKKTLVKDSFLQDLIRYEKCSLLTHLDGKVREVEISFNPYEIIPPLAEGKVPEHIHKDNYHISITPDEGYEEHMSLVYHT